MRTKQLLLGTVLALAAAATLTIAGNYHLVKNSDGARLVERVVFSFDEFIVNEDALRLMSEVEIALIFPRARLALLRDYERAIEEGRRIAAPDPK